MPGRSLALLCLTGASFVLGCDRSPMTEGLADDPMAAEAVVVTAPDSGGTGVAPPARAADRGISGPSARGTMPGMGSPGDPLLTLFDPAAAPVVTLARVVPAAARKVTPAMTLLGGADQGWRVQVGPRTDLGRKSGLMLRGGTQGQHNRWDLGASATVGDQSNVQGVIRYHP